MADVRPVKNRTDSDNLLSLAQARLLKEAWHSSRSGTGLVHDIDGAIHCTVRVVHAADRSEEYGRDHVVKTI